MQAADVGNPSESLEMLNDARNDANFQNRSEIGVFVYMHVKFTSGHVRNCGYESMYNIVPMVQSSSAQDKHRCPSTCKHVQVFDLFVYVPRSSVITRGANR